MIFQPLGMKYILTGWQTVKNNQLIIFQSCIDFMRFGSNNVHIKF